MGGGLGKIGGNLRSKENKCEKITSQLKVREPEIQQLRASQWQELLEVPPSSSSHSASSIIKTSNIKYIKETAEPINQHFQTPSPLIVTTISDESTVPSPLSAGIDRVSVSESSLTGKVFIKDDKEVRYEFIHFDKEVGCYVLFEYDDEVSNIKLDSRAAFPSGIFFTEQSFDPNKPKLSGLDDWGGTCYRSSSKHYELTFDTEFLCVLLGKSVWK